MKIDLTERTPGCFYKPAPSNWYLTDEHPRSSYGILVLCNGSDPTGHGYGPADVVITPSQYDISIFGNLAVALTSADIVAKWALENVTTESEERKIRLYLSQWPTGPQLPVHDELAERQEWHTNRRKDADHSSAYDH